MNQVPEDQDMDSNQYLAFKDWYVESNRFPKYLLTAALASIAFSLSNFAFNERITSGIDGYFKIPIGLLLGSSFLSFFTMFLSYHIFEPGVRHYLAPITPRFGIKPLKNPQKIRSRAIVTWWCFSINFIVLLLGISFLVVSFFCSLNTSEKKDTNCTEKHSICRKHER